MNELTPLEKQLRSWTPRQASPRVKQRIFGRAGVTPAATQRWHPVWWHWLAPATAALILSLTLLSQQHPLAVWTGGSNSLVTTAMISMPEIYLASHHSENNSWQRTFEWTNGSGRLNRSTILPGTNSLLQ